MDKAKTCQPKPMWVLLREMIARLCCFMPFVQSFHLPSWEKCKSFKI
ncbi:hypothetical protein OIU79_001173 [Salix purpurea]|uniref:Uncharacterized protein n=1 Tax=Salix purpurea TaxID=77065 RepID=A0A9Q0V3C1_SALPP|nr:hypothetical protein OIU79_001173 [Salix purpurea]